MKTSHCPTDQELSLFDLGDLPGEEYDELSEHLDSCPECAARFEKLDGQADGLVESLPAGAGRRERFADPRAPAQDHKGA